MSNPLSQYLDLYDADRELVDNGSAPVMNALRSAARRRLADARLPERSDEGYEKTSLGELFAPDYGINLGRLQMPMDVASSFRCDVPNMSTLLGVVANDMFVSTRTLVNNLPDGVTFMSLSEAARRYPELVARHYGQVADDSVAVALNTLLVQDGVFIHLRRGVHLDKPLQLVNIFSAAVDTLAFRRVLVVAEDDTSADILICDHTQDDAHNYLASTVVEIVAGAGATLSLLDMEESTEHTRRVCGYYVSQAEGSAVKLAAATLLNGVTRNDFHVSIEGRGAESALYGMAIGSGRQHIDNCSEVVHRSGGSRSHQIFRYVLDDSSTGAFEGGIEVAPGASGTEAFQTNKNVLAGADARMHTKPQLLIYNDDVKCSHGASTGQLDASALFYMQARGIPYTQARTMLMQAFMSDIIAAVKPEAVGDRLRHLVDKRFAGTLATCHACTHECNR